MPLIAGASASASTNPSRWRRVRKPIRPEMASTAPREHQDPAYDPLLLAPSTLYGEPSKKLAHQPTTARWHTHRFLSRRPRIKQRKLMQTGACTPLNPG